MSDYKVLGNGITGSYLEFIKSEIQRVQPRKKHIPIGWRPTVSAYKSGTFIAVLLDSALGISKWTPGDGVFSVKTGLSIAISRAMNAATVFGS